MYVKYVVGAINMLYIYKLYNPISCICFRNKVLLLLSMNFNAEFYKFSFTENNFSKFALLLTFFQSLDQIK